jgi:hypothetical protein
MQQFVAPSWLRLSVSMRNRASRAFRQTRRSENADTSLLFDRGARSNGSSARLATKDYPTRTSSFLFDPKRSRSSFSPSARVSTTTSSPGVSWVPGDAKLSSLPLR